MIWNYDISRAVGSTQGQVADIFDEHRSALSVVEALIATDMRLCAFRYRRCCEVVPADAELDQY